MSVLLINPHIVTAHNIMAPDKGVLCGILSLCLDTMMLAIIININIPSLEKSNENERYEDKASVASCLLVCSTSCMNTGVIGEFILI